MTLRPVPARWFELLTDREHLGPVLDCLARTRSVELQVTSGTTRAAELPDWSALLARHAELARRYQPWWPEPTADPALPPPDSTEQAAASLQALEAWCRHAEPRVRELQRLAVEDAALEELAAAWSAAPALPPPGALARTAAPLAARLYARTPAPDAGAAVEAPPGVLVLPLAASARRWLLALGPAEEVAQLDAALAARHARIVEWPAGCVAGALDTPESRAAARAALADRRARLERALARLARAERLAGHLARFAFLEWLVAHVPRLPATEHFAWVTGWTSDPDGRVLGRALEAAQLPYLLHFPQAPVATAPVVLRNPGWARPFELFVRLLGTPGEREADPSMLLAFVAPLLFGYMFGDVGQGAVLLAAGLLLRRRVPALALLVPGGIAAILFGFAFGSVFAREDLVPALWMHPLAQPLAVLGWSVALGVTLIAGGLLLDAAARLWSHDARRYWALQAPVPLLYAGLVGAPFWAPAWLAIGVGLLWFLLGPLALREGRAQLAERPGELLETVLQLVVNTVSFARVGAFALAHSGLSVAVVGIADASGSGVAWAVLLVLGNLLILALEGLVVGIQTTRLVLFEFFIRFLRAEGRPFRPLEARTSASAAAPAAAPPLRPATPGGPGPGRTS